MTIPDWYRPEDRAVVVAAIDRAMRDGNAQIEAELLSKDGVAHPYLLTANRFEADGRTYFMGVGIGIADRVAAEERLRKLNEELEDRVLARTRELEAAQRAVLAKEKLAALGSLVAGIAHELNTPLGAILSASASTAMAIP